MTLLMDIEGADFGSPELGARALEALTGEQYWVMDHLGIVGQRDDHLPDISTNLDALWDECERRGYDDIGIRRNKYGAIIGTVGGQSWSHRTSARLALLTALLRAAGIK